MPIRLALLLLLSAGPAHASSWLGGPDADDDAVADAPSAEDEASDPGEAVESVDLSVLTGSMEDSLRRVVVDGADPVDALPVPVTQAPTTTAAELRGLLAGSGAKDVKLHGVVVQLVLYKGSTAVLSFEATLLPSAHAVLLALAPTQVPDAAATDLELPGGLGRTWDAARGQLQRTLRKSRCDALPVASNAALATLVPLPYIDDARAARDRAAQARQTLCESAAQVEWDRLELRLDALHFNLFDESGALRGGLRLKVDPATGSFAYPMFKKPGR